jgi:hypothetical protein
LDQSIQMSRNVVWFITNISFGLLRIFVETIDNQVDRNFQSFCVHRFDLIADIEVRVQCFHPDFHVAFWFPQFVTIGAVIDRLAKDI